MDRRGVEDILAVGAAGKFRPVRGQAADDVHIRCLAAGFLQGEAYGELDLPSIARR